MATKKTTTKKGTTRKTTGSKPTAKRTAKAPPKAAAAPKRLSALDAAAQVLAKAKEPMGAKDLIEAMAKQGLWSSPGGKTPQATLYAAMIREIASKGKEARFQKVDRGQFVHA
ncbi:MAG: winged helix-turn-helix domain-containing protein [Planctomycetaceae bacterium]|nr:winged helix-turn-helix domain-containing protein [Planctomycetaceae bacterium]